MGLATNNRHTPRPMVSANMVVARWQYRPKTSGTRDAPQTSVARLAMTMPMVPLRHSRGGGGEKKDGGQGMESFSRIRNRECAGTTASPAGRAQNRPRRK